MWLLDFYGKLDLVRCHLSNIHLLKITLCARGLQVCSFQIQLASHLYQERTIYQKFCIQKVWKLVKDMAARWDTSKKQLKTCFGCLCSGHYREVVEEPVVETKAVAWRGVACRRHRTNNSTGNHLKKT